MNASSLNSGSSIASLPDLAVSRDALLNKVLKPAPGFELHGPATPGREQIEAFIVERFHTAYQARVSHFFPWLLSMQCLGTCSAVAGIRPAKQAGLFLEQYLDEPVEDELSRVLEAAVARASIVEIGNLVADKKGSSHLLFLVFTAALHKAGYRWLVFTATRGLRNNLNKLGLSLHALGNADQSRLDAQGQAQWGAYYQSNPQIMACSLEQGMQIISSRPLLRRVLRLYRSRINALALKLQDA